MSARAAVIARVAGAVLIALVASAPATLHAQYVPYYGKNKVTWDRFEWRLYRSAHFDVHYYPGEIERLQRLVALAETAYGELAEALAHEVRFRIPLIAYRSHSEFEQTHVLGAPIDESVGAFAEPALNRMVLPVDGPDDELRRLVKHELAHIFQFSLVYGGLAPQLLARRPPNWAMEGYADYVSEESDGLKRMLLRDLVHSGRIPRISRLEFTELASPVLGYSLGHAAFLAIEERWGKEGVRRLWWGFRKSTLLKSVSPWKTAFGIEDEELDRMVERWLRRAYPLDEAGDGPWRFDRRLRLGGGLDQVLALAPSPSGDLLAVLATDRNTEELDLALVSAEDGRVLRNLTPGTTESWDWLTPDGRIAEGRAIAWDRSGRQVAAFARSGKRRILLVFDAASGTLIHRHRLAVEGAGGPSFAPDGNRLAFAATGGEASGLYLLELATGRSEALGPATRDERTPVWTPEGDALVAVRREQGRDVLVRRSLDGAGEAEVLRRAPGNDTSPWFDARGDLWFVSESAGRFNVWRMAKGGGAAEQMTDLVGGAFSPVVLEGGPRRLALVGYDRGRFDAFVTEVPEPLEREVLGAAQPPPLAASTWPALDPAPGDVRPGRGLKLTRLAQTQLGVSSDGTFFGQTAAVFEDLFGDRELVLGARSLSSFRSLYVGWLNRGSRLAWGAEVYDLQEYFLADPELAASGGVEENDVVENRLRGGALRLSYPFSRLRRAEIDLAYEYRDREFEAEEGSEDPLLRDGDSLRLAMVLLEETTRFRWFGPLSGRTWRLEGRFAPSAGSWLSYATARGDARAYLQVGRTSLFALRAAGFYSWGSDPEVLAFGGSSEFRGADYLSISGTRGFLGNIELRFPLVDLVRTPLVSIGGIRATLFADLAGAWREGVPFQFASTEGGFHLVDALATIGAGLSLPALGMPLHFDWSWPTNVAEIGSSRFSVWLGYEY